MLLHLLWDEKITHRIIKTFDEVFPGENEYVYWFAHSNERHFTQEGDHLHVLYDYSSDPDIDYHRVSKVIIHGLDFDKIQFCCRNIPAHVPVYWILWGAELYNNLLFNRGYRLYYKSRPKLSLKVGLGLFLKRFGLLSKNDKFKLDFFNTRNVTMVCGSGEYDLFRSYYPKETRTLLNETEFFYYPIDEVLGEELLRSKAEGNIILIGNSASWTNNHEYVFDHIKNLDLKGKQIVVPLNYGGDAAYRDKISRLGDKYFGSNFSSLSKFLPLSEYNSLMAKAEVCIYGSWRQEAMGNIVVALYLGAKVFMSGKSPLYEDLTGRGLIIFKLEDITQESLDTPLSRMQKDNNRKILVSSNSWERLKEITYNLFKS